MPIYEYECGVCGHKLEKLQKISDEPLRDCPECEEPGLRKLVSAVTFRLRGSGWYETDFKDEKSRKNLAKDDDKPKEADAGKATTEETRKDNGKAADGTGDKSAPKETKAKPDTTKPDTANTAVSSPAARKQRTER